MSTATGSKQETVPIEEVERRVAEYRALGFKHRSPAIAVYREDSQLCPWPDCGCVIKGIDFRLEEMGDADLVNRLLESWWQGPGLIGPCPACRRLVVFRLNDKRTTDAASPKAGTRMPDDWYAKAHIVGKDSVRYAPKQ